MVENTKIVSKVLTASAACVVISLTLAPAATALNSDPDNYYLDPEEIRPFVTESLAWTMKAPDLRLLEGQVPFYSFDGEVVAYLYIGYKGAEPLPTIDEVLSKARAIGEDRDRFLKEIPHKPLSDYYTQYFPFGDTCGHDMDAVNENVAMGYSRSGIPGFIYHQYKAEDAARAYYGSDDFEFVRYLLAPTTSGYEFTNGRENIVVPFDMLSGRVSADSILTREEIDANIDEYRFPVDPERAQKWVEKWKRRLKITGSNGD